MNLPVLLPFLLILSLGLNCFFAYHLKKKHKTAQSPEFSEFLQDFLTHGNGLIRFERIAPAEVFIRSPRDYR